MLAPARYRATGRIGLQPAPGGFGTPLFGDDQQIRVEDDALVINGERHAITTLRAATALLGLPPRSEVGVYTPTTEPDPDEEIAIDPVAARVLGHWYAYCAALLEQLRAEATADDAPATVQLWPEHFDIAVDLGDKASGRRANYGGSPGDDQHAEPYLYVGPWGPYDANDPFWNEPFGASLGYADLLAGADGLEFLRDGKQRLLRHAPT